jgi:hypothetical protein
VRFTELLGLVWKFESTYRVNTLVAEVRCFWLALGWKACMKCVEQYTGSYGKWSLVDIGSSR